MSSSLLLCTESNAFIENAGRTWMKVYTCWVQCLLTLRAGSAGGAGAGGAEPQEMGGHQGGRWLCGAGPGLACSRGPPALGRMQRTCWTGAELSTGTYETQAGGKAESNHLSPGHEINESRAGRALLAACARVLVAARRMYQRPTAQACPFLKAHARTASPQAASAESCPGPAPAHTFAGRRLALGGHAQQLVQAGERLDQHLI